MWIYYFTLALIASTGVLYQIFQKTTPSSANPVVSLIISYLTAIIILLFLLPVFPLRGGFVSEIKKLNWSSILLGITLVGIELGYLLAYRVGWNIGTTQLVTTVFITSLLLPISVVFFNESISFTKIIGVVLCICGFVMISHK